MVGRTPVMPEQRAPRYRVGRVGRLILLAVVVGVVLACSSSPALPKAAGYDATTEGDAPYEDAPSSQTKS